MHDDAFLNTPCPPIGSFPEGTITRDLHITNRKGLHARASAKFVQCAEQFQADITVTRCGETVGGTSIMGLLTLAAAQGTTVTVAATGVQAKPDGCYYSFIGKWIW